MREISAATVKKRLQLTNPHWEAGEVDPILRKEKQRKYFELFFPLVQSKVNRAVVLMGPRRVGKTVLLWQAVQELIDQGYPPHKIFYASLDTPIFHPYSLEELLEIYKDIFQFKDVSGTVIIFDEIQYLKDWDVQLKVLVDIFKNTRFIASGSAASALKRKSMESGAGRFTDFLLPPLTFYEYLDLVGRAETLVSHSRGALSIDQLNKEFIQYINYGGFPEAIFDESIQVNPQRFIRSDILDKVLLRDLPSIYGISDTQELYRLFSALVFQTGTEVSYDTLCISSGIAKNTIKKYIEYLESAFLIRTVKRVDDLGKTFQRNNYFKIYLTNPSLYSAIYEPVDEADSQTLGSLVETAIFSQWMHDPSQLRNIYYARWKGGKGEVDLVQLNEKFKVESCYEIKWSDRVPAHLDEMVNLKYFCRKNKISEATVSTRTIRDIRYYDNIELTFIPSALLCYYVGYAMLTNQKFRIKGIA